MKVDIKGMDLQKTAILEFGEFACKVSFNHVKKGEYGIMPLNVWCGTLQPNDKGFRWSCACDESCKTIEDAVKIIEPSFRIVMSRAGISDE